MHPTLFEVKKAQQFFQFKLISDQPLVIEAVSENLFVSSDNELLSWQLLENGNIVQSGEVALSIPAQASLQIQLCDAIKRLPGARYHLNLQARLINATPWAESGHITACEQIELASIPKLHLAEKENLVRSNCWILIPSFELRTIVLLLSLIKRQAIWLIGW
ncbi:beta-galactosidase [Vibrio maritimus]|uniref:beta-galactosidase n=1 Tax=Vibrio maritimus TaxID=990268 RepID=A0A090SEN5_9VIBR|nr:beta-galactosidase [Vibrio maritimus]